MKGMIALSVLGAVLGGIYPGAFLAFLWTGHSGSELVCFVVNIILGVSGAFLGMQIAKESQPQIPFRPIQVIPPLVLGLLCSIIGYYWADWAISRAEPPL